MNAKIETAFIWKGNCAQVKVEYLKLGKRSKLFYSLDRFDFVLDTGMWITRVQRCIDRELVQSDCGHKLDRTISLRAAFSLSEKLLTFLSLVTN